MTRFVVFTDLDGTLLDPITYECEAAKPALERLAALGIPLVLVTSKTRAEVEALRRSMGNEHPFIVENGGAMFIPQDYFPVEISSAQDADGLVVVEWGTPYAVLIEALAAASRESGCPVRGLHDMSVEEVAAHTGLSREQAAPAKVREYDEPFLILDPQRGDALLNAIQQAGFRWARGDRFHHILGDNDKARAVNELLEQYRRAGGAVHSIGLGDAPNDAGFLRLVDAPVMMRSAFLEEMLRLVPNGLVPQSFGPAGWSEAVLALVA